MKIYYAIMFLFVFGAVILGCTKDNSKDSVENMQMEKSENEDLEFKQMCQSAGYEWMLMKPTQDGKFIKAAQECWGCMVEGIEHVCDKEKFMEFIPPR